ncbi:MAG: hypothetical protein JWR58_3150 [Pseudonocardia sp.]|nr:hypothetical protein [Pseudonocardia sp.]
MSSAAWPGRRWSSTLLRDADYAAFDQEVPGACGTVPAPLPVPGIWVPADACTLTTAEQPLRMEEFDALFATALRGLERREPGWLHLRLTADPQVEASARELIERESECCSFFDFRLTHADGDLRLDVRVPEGRVDVVDGIARQAEAARAQAQPGSAW